LNDWLTPAVSFRETTVGYDLRIWPSAPALLLLAGPIFSNKRLKAYAMIRTELSFTFDPWLAPSVYS
jgi:hypothetical protein